MARRLAGARILASSMKGTDKGAHAWETQGGRYPGMHVGDQKIKINHGGGGKMADVSKEEIEELKTDLEEQNGTVGRRLLCWSKLWFKEGCLVRIMLQCASTRVAESAEEPR